MDRTGGPKGSVVEIRVRRLNPHSQGGTTDSVYTLDYSEGMTLQSALEEIYKRLDPSLAFRPYRCNKGVCMSCLVSVDGKRRQACTTFLKPRDRLFVEPDPAYSLIRDLVTVF